mgnify:CR=1 FL=1
MLTRSLGLLFLFGFLLRLFVFLLLTLPVIQQLDDLVLHFPRRSFLAEILAQFRTCQNHFVYLLFVLHHNAVDHIPVELLDLTATSTDFTENDIIDRYKKMIDCFINYLQKNSLIK